MPKETVNNFKTCANTLGGGGGERGVVRFPCGDEQMTNKNYYKTTFIKIQLELNSSLQPTRSQVYAIPM